MGRGGSRTQPVMPASPSDAPITLRKPRRETESTHSDAPLGNSRCSASWKSSLPASSSRLRQYSGPVFSAASCAVAWSIRARTDSRSSLPFLLGQTSSRFAPCRSELFSSSIVIATTCKKQTRVPHLARSLREKWGFRRSPHTYLWHVLQLVISFTLRTLYFLSNAAPRSS